MITNATKYIIDAQVHVWAANSSERPWRRVGAMYAHGPDSFEGRNLIPMMDAAGVRRAVLVPPSWEGDRNDLALAAAREFPERFAVMGRIPLELPKASRRAITNWREQSGMLGLRVTFARDVQRGWLVDGTANWLWPAAEAAELPVMVYAPGSVARIGEIAAAHPRLRLIIDHVGLRTDAQEGDIDSAVREVVKLAKYPNLAVKASALPCHVAESYPFSRLHEPVRRLVQSFGPERVFWGSDLTRLPCAYKDAVNLFAEALEFNSDGDREWVLGRGIAAWLNWAVADAPWQSQP